MATTRPDLALQWHPTLNGNITPKDIIAGTDKKYWWICEKGHPYLVSPDARLRGCGCPYCAGKRAFPGYNDLSSQRPELASQWHPIKNGGLKPSDVVLGSGKKAWWVCDKGHEWQAVINSRVAGNNCPYCGNQKLLPGFNDLSTVRPDIASQWHPTKNGDVKPSDVFPSAGKKYWWMCDKGHEWQSSPNNRIKVPYCPYCSGFHPISGQTDFASLYPELANEWHPIKNVDIDLRTLRPGSIVQGWWVCSEGHEWKTTISARVGGVNCPYCSGRELIKGKNDLATVYPELAREWHPIKNHPLTPSDVKPGSIRKVWWMCEKGHEWEATLSDRSRSKGCPFCAMGRQASFNEKAILICLQKTFPELVFESNYSKFRKDGISELDIYIPELSIGIEYDGPRHTNYERDNGKSSACRNMGIKLFRIKEHLRKGDESKFDDVFMWVTDHAQDNEINEVIRKLESEIASAQGLISWESHADMLRYRSEINEILLVHPKRRLDMIYPDVAKEWHPTKNGTLLPSEVYAGSNRKVWWMCEKGHEWEAVVSSRSKSGCPFCSNRRVIAGENDLATTNPGLISEWHPTKNGNLTPMDVSPGSSKAVWWMCKEGHEWKAVISLRVQGIGCPYCKGKKLWPGFNDLQTKNPELAAEWHPTKNGDLTPSDVMSSTADRIWWVCKRGHEWEATLNSRSRGLGCPFCSGRRVIPGETDLATLKPRMAKEWHPTKNGDLRPDMITADSHLEIWWCCKYGHVWKKAPHGRGRCPYCSGKLMQDLTKQTKLQLE